MAYGGIALSLLNRLNLREDVSINRIIEACGLGLKLVGSGSREIQEFWLLSCTDRSAKILLLVHCGILLAVHVIARLI